MTYEEINQMISDMGFGYAYYQFPDGSAPSAPYILFYYPERRAYQADDVNFVKIAQLVIEFYSPEKNFEGEETIESILADNEIPYTAEENYIETEHMFVTSYNMEVIINES